MASLEEEEDFKRCLSSVLLGLNQRGFKFILEEEQERGPDRGKFRQATWR